MNKNTIENLGLKQFDSNPTDDPDLLEMIAETWIEKALYYGIKKCGGFSWRESWVVVDGTTYNISINNTDITGHRCCASLDIELDNLKKEKDKVDEKLEKVEQENEKLRGALDVGLSKVSKGLKKENIKLTEKLEKVKRILANPTCDEDTPHCDLLRIKEILETE